MEATNTNTRSIATELSWDPDQDRWEGVHEALKREHGDQPCE